MALKRRRVRSGGAGSLAAVSPGGGRCVFTSGVVIVAPGASAVVRGTFHGIEDAHHVQRLGRVDRLRTGVDHGEEVVDQPGVPRVEWGDQARAQQRTLTAGCDREALGPAGYELEDD